MGRALPAFVASRAWDKEKHEAMGIDYAARQREREGGSEGGKKEEEELELLAPQ